LTFSHLPKKHFFTCKSFPMNLFFRLDPMKRLERSSEGSG
jgi:hypothetical protein